MLVKSPQTGPRAVCMTYLSASTSDDHGHVGTAHGNPASHFIGNSNMFVRRDVALVPPVMSARPTRRYGVRSSSQARSNFSRTALCTLLMCSNSRTLHTHKQSPRIGLTTRTAGRRPCSRLYAHDAAPPAEAPHKCCCARARTRSRSLAAAPPTASLSPLQGISGRCHRRRQSSEWS